MASAFVDSPAQSSTEIGESWGTNVVWKSFEVEEWEKYSRFCREELRAHAEAHDPPYIPITFQAYICHRLAVLEHEMQELKLKIAAKEQRLAMKKGRSGVRILPIFGGKNLEASTELLARRILSTTAEDIFWSRTLDLNADFIKKAEALLGEELLKEL